MLREYAFQALLPRQLPDPKGLDFTFCSIRSAAAAVLEPAANTCHNSSAALTKAASCSTSPQSYPTTLPSYITYVTQLPDPAIPSWYCATMYVTD